MALQIQPYTTSQSFSGVEIPNGADFKTITLALQHVRHAFVSYHGREPYDDEIRTNIDPNGDGNTIQIEFRMEHGATIHPTYTRIVEDIMRKLQKSKYKLSKESLKLILADFLPEEENDEI